MNNRRYDIGNVKTRYNDSDKSDETPFVDNAVNPPKNQHHPQPEECIMGKKCKLDKCFGYVGEVPKMATRPRSMVMDFSPTRRERSARMRATTQHVVK
jgi:hypothetical protein